MSDKTVYSRRNPAIDMLRALTMFTMIFVNDFWKVHDVPHWLEHAVYGEDFMGLADIVFPCFLFAVGIMGHRTKRILRIERKEYQTY